MPGPVSISSFHQGYCASNFPVHIFKRSLFREFTAIGLSVLTVLTTIFLIFQLVRLLGRVADGLQEPEAVIALLGFALLSYLPVVLSLSLFIAVLLTLSRSYRDSEMPVWFSSGLPLTAWVKPVLGFGLPVVAIIALLSLVLTPWALAQSVEYQRILRSRDDVSRLTPGNFMETRSANQLSFVNPRSGTSWNLIFAILIFFLYYHSMGIFQAWTASGKIPAWIGLAPVHLAMLAVLLGLFWKQLFGFRWLVLSRK